MYYIDFEYYTKREWKPAFELVAASSLEVVSENAESYLYDLGYLPKDIKVTAVDSPRGKVTNEAYKRGNGNPPEPHGAG